jgi:hypothetical protein
LSLPQPPSKAAEPKITNIKPARVDMNAEARCGVVKGSRGGNRIIRARIRVLRAIVRWRVAP